MLVTCCITNVLLFISIMAKHLVGVKISSGQSFVDWILSMKLIRWNIHAKMCYFDPHINYWNNFICIPLSILTDPPVIAQSRERAAGIGPFWRYPGAGRSSGSRRCAPKGTRARTRGGSRLWRSSWTLSKQWYQLLLQTTDVPVWG